MPDNPQIEEDTPRGLLFLLQPEYADLIPPEEKFVNRMVRAAKEGQLCIGDAPYTVH